MNEIKTCHMSDDEIDAFLSTRTESRRPEYVPPPQRVQFIGTPSAHDKRFFRGGFGRRSRKQMHRIAA